MNVIIIVFCVVKWLLWKSTLANTCDDTPYRLPSHVLLHHVIQSLQGTSSIVSCLDHCEDNSKCHSINWYSITGLCQLNDGTHLSYPEGLVPDSTGRYILYSLRPMVTCSNKFCSHGDICLMEKNGINYRCESTDCIQPLGMEDGRIKNSQITASSSYSTGKPYNGRLNAKYVLNQNAGGWTARASEPGQYLQVDLLRTHIITKVATQGRGYSQYPRWVTKYYLTYNQDGTTWKSYKYGGVVKEFVGNTNIHTIVERTLPSPIKAKLIRVVVLAWQGGRAAMRIELYGCVI